MIILFHAKKDAAIILQNPLKQYLISYKLPGTFKLLKHVDRDCKLREYFIETLSHIVHEFRRGHTYYEFTNKVEDILEGKEVLLQDKQNPEKWLRFKNQPEDLAANGLNLYGEGIARSSFGEQYRVFIQSFGSGARFLPRHSSILYNRGDQVDSNYILDQ